MSKLPALLPASLSASFMDATIWSVWSFEPPVRGRLDTILIVPLVAPLLAGVLPVGAVVAAGPAAVVAAATGAVVAAPAGAVVEAAAGAVVDAAGAVVAVASPQAANIRAIMP